EADPGGNGHVVDGQQRMRSTKQDPGPGGDVQAPRQGDTGLRHELGEPDRRDSPARSDGPNSAAERTCSDETAAPATTRPR
ncbi:hypothetical protein ABIA38_007689, partial [Embleya sp. AB8]